MPERLDRVLRLIVITPDVHRVHHSATDRCSGSSFRALPGLVATLVYGFINPWNELIFAIILVTRRGRNTA